MTSAKDLVLKPISAKAAKAVIQRLHYSGKTTANSQLHFGAFLNGRLEGALQFGPSLDKRKVKGCVKDTGWNDFLELNRMAFSEALPRNSESRALGVALRMIKKNYPHIEWVVSFSDGTQCGDGTIYRAAGFDLIGIKENSTIWEAPDGSASTDISLRLGKKTIHAPSVTKNASVQAAHAKALGVSMSAANGASSMRPFIEAGYKKKKGFQLKYIYFLNRKARDRLTVPVLPFSEIDRVGAGMYLGEARAK